MKYAAVINYWPNCRAHDINCYSKLKFFATAEDVIKYTLEEVKYGFNIADLYSLESYSNEKCLDVSYDFSGHHISIITFIMEDGTIIKYKPHEYKKDEWQLMRE